VERVAFIVDDSDTRIDCLLNPESVVIRRQAGVRRRELPSGPIAGAGLDDPLLLTGGGRTELELELLFDTGIAGTPDADVRELSGPIWRLAEQSEKPEVRFVWGKAWNVPGVISSIAERFEQFSPAGAPRQSWMRLRFIRIGEQRVKIERSAPPPEDLPSAVGPGEVRTHQVQGEGLEGERLDAIAARYYGSPGYWRLLASYNEIDDPSHLTPGTVLRIPPIPGAPQ
jgi:hypothetical protein